jgi:hypothetical protein
VAFETPCDGRIPEHSVGAEGARKGSKLVRQTIRSARHVVFGQQIAIANLALLEYTSVSVRHEGTFASALQVLFGAAAVLAGAFVYLYLPGIPPMGRLITVVSLQPTASLMATFTSLALVFGRERSRPPTRVPYRTLLASGAAFPTLLEEFDASLKEGRSTLAARQMWLRLGLRTGAAWFVASLVIIYVGNRWWPNQLSSIVGSHFPVAYVSLGILVPVAVFAGIGAVRRRWVARR